MTIFRKNLSKAGTLLLVLFILLVLYRMYVLEREKQTEAAVAKIHATKLTMNDVLGKNLPPDPGAEADKTIAGIDANKNGIRDDVELAIFKAYPNSAKTRAVLLQYALALQMESTWKTGSTDVVTEVIRKQISSSLCVGDNTVQKDDLISFVRNLQWNRDERKIAHDKFYSKVESFEDPGRECDVDLVSL